MIPALVNGAEVNGTEGGGTSGLAPVRFGAAVVACGQAAAGAAPLQFGTPKAQLGIDVLARAAGTAPVRFGFSAVVAGPPKTFAALCPAVGVMPVRLGIPGGVSDFVAGAPAPLRPLRFGVAALRTGQAASGMQAVHLGSHGPAVCGANAQGLAPARFGAAVVRLGFTSRGLAPLRLGIPGGRAGGTYGGAEGLAPIRMGSHGPVGAVAAARPLHPVRFGAAAVSLEASC